MTPRDILEKAYGYCLTLTADGDKLHVAGDTEPKPELLEAIREHKAAVLALLASMPIFTADDERRLVGWYCQQPRERRLAIHRNGMALRRDKQWPCYVADLEAMREAMEGKP